jgi:hypothetical protein
MNQQEYDDIVQMHAEQCVKESNDDDELSDIVFESVESSEITFKTNLALDALRHSHNGPQEWQHLVRDGDSWQEVVRALAFDAVRTDVWDEIRELQE